MSIFGWSYPPGCSGPPDEDRDDFDKCPFCGKDLIDSPYHQVDECGESVRADQELQREKEEGIDHKNFPL